MIRTGGKQVAAIGVRTSAGLRLVSLGALRTADGLKTFHSALSAAVDNPFVSASLYARGTPTITTPSATVTAAGGVAPYSYAWTSPDGNWSASSPDQPYSNFARINVGPGQLHQIDWTCAVTDASGATTAVVVTAQVSNTYPA